MVLLVSGAMLLTACANPPTYIGTETTGEETTAEIPSFMPDDESLKTGFYGDKLHVNINGRTLVYERDKAGTGSLTPAAHPGGFTRETETEGVIRDVYSAKKYQDLS